MKLHIRREKPNKPEPEAFAEVLRSCGNVAICGNTTIYTSHEPAKLPAASPQPDTEVDTSA